MGYQIEAAERPLYPCQKDLLAHPIERGPGMDPINPSMTVGFECHMGGCGVYQTTPLYRDTFMPSSTWEAADREAAVRRMCGQLCRYNETEWKAKALREGIFKGEHRTVPIGGDDGWIFVLL